jgi:hypothetical protein
MATKTAIAEINKSRFRFWVTAGLMFSASRVGLNEIEIGIRSGVLVLIVFVRISRGNYCRLLASREVRSPIAKINNAFDNKVILLFFNCFNPPEKL